MGHRVNVCGLTRREDAELAIELGATAIGFVLEPSSPRALAEVPMWANEVAGESFVVAVMGPYRADLPLIRATAVQALDPVPRSNFPGWRIRVLRPRPSDSIEAHLERTSDAEAILLDAPSEAAYGGTGKTVDWAWAADFVAACPIPVVLAGGLNPENVASAIEQVRPYSVDVSSGLEASPGIKSPDKMREFFKQLGSF